MCISTPFCYAMWLSPMRPSDLRQRSMYIVREARLNRKLEQNMKKKNWPRKLSGPSCERKSQGTSSHHILGATGIMPLSINPEMAQLLYISYDTYSLSVSPSPGYSKS